MHYYLIWDERFEKWALGNKPLAIPDPEAEEHVVVAHGSGLYDVEEGFIITHPDLCLCRVCSPPLDK